jgi:hypothetical protein
LGTLGNTDASAEDGRGDWWLEDFCNGAEDDVLCVFTPDGDKDTCRAMGCDFPLDVDKREVACEVVGVESVFTTPMLADLDVLAPLRVACAETLEGVADVVGNGEGPLSARDLDFPLTDGGDGDRGGGSGTTIVINVSTRRDLTTLSKVR